MKKSKVEHLTKEDIIKNGSIFTPADIVKKAKKYILSYINEKTTIIDFGAGYGAFISEFLDCPGEKVATEIDEMSIELLRRNYPNIKVIYENSLLNIDRTKYCSDKKEIVVIGNPPYNDITSQYKKGQKGNAFMDSSIYSRDLGIAFLRMYGKIEAEAICVLHPFSYLLKEQNFKALKEFKDNYRLKKACIFSSSLFESIKKGNAEFPVLIALYEKSNIGMDYEYIRKFKFDIYKEKTKFCIFNFKTIDGVVQKYPTKIKSDNDLQFYTLRDINALKRNKSFLVGYCSNGIKVSLENLHYYAWLDFFKNYFDPDKPYLYGNLSPFLPDKISEDKIRLMLYGYIINENKTVSNWLLANETEFYNSNQQNKYSIKELKELMHY